MATYYWIGGTGNWSNTAKWSLTSNGATAGVVPTASDDVIFDTNSDGSASTNFTVTADVSDCAANNITITTDRVITFDGGVGNLSANFWTQNSSASTTGAVLNNTISINSNVTVNRGVFTANGTLTIGNNFFANGFGTPATANRVVFTLANTMITGTFTANASNWFWQNFNFSANSRLYLTGRNRAIFAMQSPNIAMTWGTNTAIIANGAGVPGETRNLYLQFVSPLINNANATANLNPFALNITNGSDIVNFHTDSGYFGGIDFTGFSGNANLQSNLWCANGNLVLSPTMNLTSSSRYIRIGGWSGSNTGIITNGFSGIANIGINFNSANINANIFLANNLTLEGTSAVIDVTNSNINLGNNILAARSLVLGNGNCNINFNTSGEIILTGSNQTVFTGRLGNVAAAQGFLGNVKITSNYSGGTGNRTFITGYSNLTIKVTGSNGIFIGNTATDNIRILSNASSILGSGSGRALIDLRGMTNTLLNSTRSILGPCFFPSADKMQAGSNITAFVGGAVDSQGSILPFPLQFGTGEGSQTITVTGNNLESTGEILIGGGSTLSLSNVKVIGTKVSSNNTVSASQKQVIMSGTNAEIVVTAGNTTIIDISGNTTWWVNNDLNSNCKIRSSYTGSEGTRTVILGNQTFVSSNTRDSVSTFTLGFTGVGKGIELNTTATDTVLVNGHIFNLDLTGMNCSWNQGNVNVYGNFTSEASTGTLLPSANTLNVIGQDSGNQTIFCTILSNGVFTGTTTANIGINSPVRISGTLTGTATISGYVNPTTYYVINYSTPNPSLDTIFQLSATLGGPPITTTAGTSTGLSFTVGPQKRSITGKSREHDFNISGPVTSGGLPTVSIVGNLVLANTRTYTQQEGNLTLDANSKITTGIFVLSAPTDTTTYVTNFGSNSSMEITGSNTTVFSANRYNQYGITGTPSVYFSYSGSTGNRILNIGGSGLTSGGTNALTNIFSFGTNTSSNFYFNPAATDTIVFVANSNINDLNMSQWSGNLSLGNAGVMYVRGNISLPITGNIVNTSNINWAIVTSSIVRSFNFNNTIPNANIVLTAFSSSVGGNYLFSDNINLSNTRGLYWNFGNLEFSEGINVTAQLFNNGSLTTPQRHWKTGNANITLTGSGTTVLNIGNLQSITGDIKVLSNYNGTSGIRTFVGGSSGQGNLTPTYDLIIGNSFVSNAIVVSPSGDALNLGGRFRNVDLSNAASTQNMVLTTVGYQVYGNYTLPVSNGTFTAGSGTLTFQGQNTTQYINTNARRWEINVAVNASNTEVIMTGNFTMGNNASTTWTLSNGTLNMNGFRLNTGTFQTGTGTKSIVWNGGSMRVSTSNALAWNANVPANFTVSAGTGAGRILMSGAAAKSFVGGNINYNATLDQNGAGNLTITGNNQFKDIVMTATNANTWIFFPASGNTTVESFTGSGINAERRLGMVSSTAGTRSTIHLTDNGTANSNWANISDINFTPMVTNGTGPMVWYVGANSINNGNVSGALFANGGENAPLVYAIESGSSWTVPNNWNSSNNVVYLYGAGGGGAGGRPTSLSSKAAGAGGGGGGFTAITNFSTTPGQTISYSIGIGGAGGAANANGTAGGNTIWSSTFTANGGNGGGTTSTPTSVPGQGGTGATANGGNGGQGATTTVSNNGSGGGGGGGSGGPNGVGGAGGAGITSTTSSPSGGGGGGSGGGFAGANAAVANGGSGGNNFAGVGGGLGGAGAGAQGTRGGGGGGGRNANAAGKGGSGIDVLNSIGGGGGSGGTANIAGSNNDVTRTYGGGGGGGGVSTATTGFAGGSGANGAIIILYYACTGPVFSSTSTMFLTF